MTGLQKIISQITDEATQAAQEQISDAEKKAEEIIAAAQSEANEQSERIAQQAEIKIADIKERALSAIQLEKRNRILLFKQNYISDIIEKMRGEFENAPDAEYFEYLLKLVSLSARNEAAAMRLNQRDLNRLPADFEKRAAEAAGAAVTVSSSPCDISGGFLLIYDGIDINCSFSAIFEEKNDQLRDAVSNLLFPENE